MNEHCKATKLKRIYLGENLPSLLFIFLILTNVPFRLLAQGLPLRVENFLQEITAGRVQSEIQPNGNSIELSEDDANSIFNVILKKPLSKPETSALKRLLLISTGFKQELLQVFLSKLNSGRTPNPLFAAELIINSKTYFKIDLSAYETVKKQLLLYPEDNERWIMQMVKLLNIDPTIENALYQDIINTRTPSAKLYLSLALLSKNDVRDPYLRHIKYVVNSFLLANENPDIPLILRYIPSSYFNAPDATFILPNLCLSESEPVKALAKREVVRLGASGIGAIRHLNSLNEQSLAIELASRTMRSNPSINKDQFVSTVKELALSCGSYESILKLIDAITTTSYNVFLSNGTVVENLEDSTVLFTKEQKLAIMQKLNSAKQSLAD